jgi:hypothetical protein
VHATPPARRLRLCRGLRLKLRNGCLAAVRLAGGHTLRARSTARRARIAPHPLLFWYDEPPYANHAARSSPFITAL